MAAFRPARRSGRLDSATYTATGARGSDPEGAVRGHQHEVPPAWAPRDRPEHRTPAPEAVMTLPLSTSNPLRLSRPPRADRRRPRTRRAIGAEERLQADTLRLIPSENYVSAAVLVATGTCFRTSTPRATPAAATTRAAEHRPRRGARRRARQGPLRRRARQRPALLRLARQPRRLPRLRRARRHRAGHVAADGRPPHPRLGRLGDRQVVRSVQYGVTRRHRPHRLRRGARPRP